MHIRLIDVGKAYGDLPVLDQLNMELYSGFVYCLMGASGSGKTTLLRILLGLEQADSGQVSGLVPYQLSAVFQEDRLCESFSPLDNILMVTGQTMTPAEVFEEIAQLLPEESICRPTATLSGGMKRRVAILRALLAPTEGILMDEPFTGLDEDTKQLVIRYILKKTAGRLLLITTHQEEDVNLLGGQLLKM